MGEDRGTPGGWSTIEYHPDGASEEPSPPPPAVDADDLDVIAALLGGTEDEADDGGATLETALADTPAGSDSDSSGVSSSLTDVADGAVKPPLDSVLEAANPTPQDDGDRVAMVEPAEPEDEAAFGAAGNGAGSGAVAASPDARSDSRPPATAIEDLVPDVGAVAPGPAPAVPAPGQTDEAPTTNEPERYASAPSDSGDATPG